MSLLVSALQVPIRAYRLLVSPWLAPSCRYLPTCSAYALEALERHGPWAGSLLAVRRLLRCHPIRWLGGGEGFDPVPPRQRHSGAEPLPAPHALPSCRSDPLP